MADVKRNVVCGCSAVLGFVEFDQPKEDSDWDAYFARKGYKCGECATKHKAAALTPSPSPTPVN